MPIRLHRHIATDPRPSRRWRRERSQRHWEQRLALFAVFAGFVFAGNETATAQISAPRMATTGGNKVATLDEQLINRLRATTDERQTYLRIIAAKTEQGVFDQRRILAIERYAMKRNPNFPFPYFERAMRNEAERLGVYLPPVRLLAGPAYQLLR